MARPGRYKDSKGQVYETLASGALVRVHPQRPWRGKAERRQVIKARRAEQEPLSEKEAA